MSLGYFPEVVGRDLLGREYRLPGQFPARATVAIIAFKRSHQQDVDAWIGALERSGVPTTPLNRSAMTEVVLELPVLSGRYQVARRFIDGGMAASIRDPAVLARTITVYGSVDGLCDPLGITSREEVSVRIVARDGSIAWGTTGKVNEPEVRRVLSVLSHIKGDR